MVSKKPYIEKLLEIRDRLPISMWEMAIKIDVAYETMRTILDPDNDTQIKESTARKIKAFINQHYKDISYGTE